MEPGRPGLPRGVRGRRLASGLITGKEGDKFKAGKLGEYTVGKDATVLLGDPFTFNAANIDEFNF